MITRYDLFSHLSSEFFLSWTISGGLGGLDLRAGVEVPSYTTGGMAAKQKNPPTPTGSAGGKVPGLSCALALCLAAQMFVVPFGFRALAEDVVAAFLEYVPDAVSVVGQNVYVPDERSEVVGNSIDADGGAFAARAVSRGLFRFVAFVLFHRVSFLGSGTDADTVTGSSWRGVRFPGSAAMGDTKEKKR
jgi:hypothetical protein